VAGELQLGFWCKFDHGEILPFRTGDIVQSFD